MSHDDESETGMMRQVTQLEATLEECRAETASLDEMIAKDPSKSAEIADKKEAALRRVTQYEQQLSKLREKLELHAKKEEEKGKQQDAIAKAIADKKAARASGSPH